MNIIYIVAETDSYADISTSTMEKYNIIVPRNDNDFWLLLITY